MEKENGNSGEKRYFDVHGQGTRFNPNVKGVGQECPTHTGKVTGVGPFGGAQGREECPSHMEVIDLQAVADGTSKRTGEAVEAAFLNKVCGLRIPVCKPWGDSERYDFVVDWGKGFWRVQVKGGSYYERSKYQVGAGGKGKPFTKEDMDFVVVYIVPEDLWYVVPIEIAEGLSALWFNPRSTRARFEKYREAWCLLDCPRKVRGRGDIPIRCRSEEVKVRCAVCPLRGQSSCGNQNPKTAEVVESHFSKKTARSGAPGKLHRSFGPQRARASG
ncbi:MAG TPA: group I intron-associated PD-(D/E)XK endonuclease [Candidatus Eremiobacteraceae bacterium]|nr:group I intron-associated PD-(D/E)XK endonuclease [Candidatus Eremiobacteraceae bacterium]